MAHLNVRRIVTGHDEHGNAVISSDTTLSPRTSGGPTQSVLAWTTDGFPTDNNSDNDGALRRIHRVSAGGAALHIMTLPPHTASEHHRTRSQDYGIVLDGHITLELDSGRTTVCHPGDVVIQRGTIHTWRNETDQPTTMAFVLLDALPVKIGDRELAAET